MRRNRHAIRLPEPFYQRAEHVAIELPGAHAVFTTRRGGVSTGACASLNLGRLTEDRPEAVEHNRALLEADLGVQMAHTRQVHGAEVLRLTAASREDGPLPEADGQATAVHGVAPTVLAADCLPIAVAGEGAVAMLHAGWRGLAAGIIDEGVRALRALGADGPLSAAIGPGAGGCCYEVGEEVQAVFAGWGDGARLGRNLDLKAIARSALAAVGVDTVHDVQLCTICGDPSLLFSHRRDGGVTGRQAGVVWLS